ncbi:MAG TPA: metallophosphoesterase [Candidatus Levilactobacillus faecigallinarum]|uniref:Metallophosphoesterase n=1 Tax=Candidatus Levilactobacillus faecigallinarum TaxID=2838638 RepID=A0A9D1QTZ2_9LACO|nr:metallophosphoesterase [Candidatus Levilactobacillus faecigallinarum]
MQLKLREDDSFRICQLTDIHLSDYPLNAASLKTLAAIDELLATHEFDLVMLTGDLIWGALVTQPDKVLGALYAVLNHYPVAVAVTYGNHDTEGMFSRDNLRQLEQALVYPADKHHAMILDDRESYTLEISQNNHLKHVLYVWDSGAYSHWPQFEQYAAIEPGQIDWFYQLPYARQRDSLDLGFLHIPLPEYHPAAENIITGVKNEPTCSPVTNTGLFYTLLRSQNVKALFVGHDHDNNFTANYRGITLAYGNVTGYNTYGNLPRGAREITLTSTGVTTKLLPF